MNHTYQIEGVTCNNCVNKVKQLLGGIEGIKSVEASSAFDKVNIEMDFHVSTAALNAKLEGTKYSLKEEQSHAMPAPIEEKKRIIATYKPVLLLFGYITAATFGIQLMHHHIDYMQWMSHFMGGFFLAFSYFKLLDVPGFAASYSSYDIIARRWIGYGYAYPFIELALGLLFITGALPFFTNMVTLVVMGISTIGVINSLVHKRKFQCACMGAVFNLPMSIITLIEDLLMVVMSAIMLFLLD
jgi:copper chaperone CopZ